MRWAASGLGRLMRLMGLRTLEPGPATSRRNRRHRVYPYLLWDRVIDCQYRINISQKCRLEIPHFGLPPLPPRALAATRRLAFDGPGSAGSIELVILREIVMIHDLHCQGLVQRGHGLGVFA